MKKYTSDKHIEALGEQLERYRLLQNIPQAELAQTAGISTRTLRRVESGEGGSMDSFIRVLIALNIDSHLSLLIPDSTVRPMERARPGKSERVRASRSKKILDKQASTSLANQSRTSQESASKPDDESGWVWGDEKP